MENECGRRRKKKLSRKYNNEQTNDDNRCFATSVCHSSAVLNASSVCIIWWCGVRPKSTEYTSSFEAGLGCGRLN